MRPTVLEALGLTDSYVHDGRVVTQLLHANAYSGALFAQLGTAETLGAIYKQINAPFGAFGTSILQASTHALAGDDTTYHTIESQIAGLTLERDALAFQIRAALDGAAFGSTALDAAQAAAWITQAQALLDQAAALASQ